MCQRRRFVQICISNRLICAGRRTIERTEINVAPGILLTKSRRPAQPAMHPSYQLPVAIRTMTGHRMTTNSTGKMQTIIGTESLAGKA
jgi:hypothetical protein